MKKLLLFLIGTIVILIMGAAPAHAQLGAVSGYALAPQSFYAVSPRGIVVMGPIAYGQVRVCTVPASGSPCSPVANIFDQFGNPVSIVGGNFGQITTDNTGFYNFQCNTGEYEVQVAASASNVTQNTFFVSCPAVSTTNIFGLNNTWTGTNNFNNTVTINGSLFLPLISTNQILFMAAGNQVGGSNNFLWDNVGLNFTCSNPVAATNTVPQPSCTRFNNGNYWTGAASAPEICSDQVVPGAGPNPSISWNFGCTGSTGAVNMNLPPSVDFTHTSTVSANVGFQGQNGGTFTIQASPSPFISTTPVAWWTTNPVSGQVASATNTGSPVNLQWTTPAVQCGALATNGTCANTLTLAEHCISGTAALTAGTSTIIGISPAFTSTSSFTVITNDTTTIANPSKGVPASTTSITFTGTGTDVLNFIACGG